MTSNPETLPNILIVDDIEENIQYLETIISSFNVTIIKAYSGPEALEKIKNIDLALAIIDVWMPGMNGYELAMHMNETKKDNKVPVIFLTASLNNEVEKLKGYNSGAVYYIFKPVNTGVIHSKVTIFLDLYKQKQKILSDAWSLRQYAEQLSEANESLKKSEEKEKNLTAELKNTLDNLENIVQQRTEELSRTEELYHTTVNSLTDWICVSDEDSNVVFVNDALSRVLAPNGMNFSDTGKKLNELLHFLNGKHLTLYKTVFKSGKTKSIDGLFSIFGKEYFLKIKLSPVLRNNKAVRVITTIYDFTQHKIAEKEILKNLEKEVYLNKMKSQFISTVSHEFRTPLAGIHSSVQLLQNFEHKWDNAKKEKLYTQIYDAIKRTKSLLDDISLLDNEKSKGICISPVKVNLDELLNNIIEECKQAYGTDVVVECNFTNTDQIRHADEGVLRTVLGNVISNAIKYSSVTRVVKFDATVNKEEMCFVVTDFGIGIPKEDLNLIFEPFCRASNTYNIKGTGFGLSLVKKYIDTCKGAIDVVSEMNKGTTVTIKIPCLPE